MSCQTHDSTAAPPSHTVPALALSSTAQPSLDPLWGNDPWASAVAFQFASEVELGEDEVETGSSIMGHCQNRCGTARGRRDSGDEDELRASKHSPRQIDAEAMVQPTTLPEGWTVFLNASLCGHNALLPDPREP